MFGERSLGLVMGKEVPAMLLTMDKFVGRGGRVVGSDGVGGCSLGKLIQSLDNGDLKV